MFGRVVPYAVQPSEPILIQMLTRDGRLASSRRGLSRRAARFVPPSCPTRRNPPRQSAKQDPYSKTTQVVADPEDGPFELDPESL